MEPNVLIQLLVSHASFLPYVGIVAMLLLGSAGLPIPESPQNPLLTLRASV